MQHLLMSVVLRLQHHDAVIFLHSYSYFPSYKKGTVLANFIFKQDFLCVSAAAV